MCQPKWQSKYVDVEKSIRFENLEYEEFSDAYFTVPTNSPFHIHDYSFIISHVANMTTNICNANFA